MLVSSSGPNGLVDFPIDDGGQLVLFSLDSCEPCHLISDALDEIAAEGGLAGVSSCLIVKAIYGIDHEHPALKELGVRHFPTLLLFLEGAFKAALRGGIQKDGPVNRERLLKWLSRHGVEPNLASMSS